MADTRDAVDRQQQRLALQTQERSEREVGRAARAQAEAAKKAARRERSPVQDLIDYVEIAGLVGLVFLLRKPIKKAVDWVLEQMRKHVEKVEAAAIAAELAARNKIAQTYLLDPVFAPKIGGEMYTQLVLRGRWLTEYRRLEDPPPAEMADEFVVGSGSGRVAVTSEVVHLFAEEAQVFFRYLVEKGEV